MHIPGVIKIYSDYKAKYIIHFKIYTIQSKANIQILRSSHLTSGRKSSDFLAWTLSSLRQRSMKTVFFLLKSVCLLEKEDDNSISKWLQSTSSSGNI